MENINGEAVRVEGSAAAAPSEGEGRAASAEGRAGAALWPAARAATRERLFVLLFGALLVGAAFWQLQYATDSVCCGDFDAYYHFRWSRMLYDGALAGRFPPSFDALPLTTLNARDYVDHHFLFHVLQVPFTLFGDIRDGAKFGTWLFACLAVFACYWLLVRYRLSFPLVWLVLILGSAAPFLYRIHMGKAMSVSIVLLVAGIYLLFERRYAWLLPLSFVFALTYDMFLLLWVAAGLWSAVLLWGERRVEWRPLLFVAGGSFLGYIINPYFPHNVQLIYQHVLMKVTAKDFSTAVGGEWYPYTTLEFLANCGPAFAAMVVGYVAFRDSTRRAQQRPLFFLLFSTFLMLVNMRWRRFSEYWPPFAIMFAAFALEPLVERLRAGAAGILAPAAAGTTDTPDETEPASSTHRTEATRLTDTTDELRMTRDAVSGDAADDAAAATAATAATGRRLDDETDDREAAPPPSTHAAAGWRSRWVEHEAAAVGILTGALLYFVALRTHAGTALAGALVAGAAVVAVLAYVAVRGWAGAFVMAAALSAFGVLGWYHRITVGDIASMPNHDRYRAGMEWVAKNVPAGEPLYNADWDDFPKLFYYDPARPYIAGLDPTYLLDRNPALMKHYERIGKGEEEDPGPVIREHFCVGEGDARRCARYVFMDHEHEAFFNNALDSGWFEVAYEDADCSILRLRDRKGDPPPDNQPPGGQPPPPAPADQQTGDEPNPDEEAGDEEGESQ